MSHYEIPSFDFRDGLDAELDPDTEDYHSNDLFRQDYHPREDDPARWPPLDIDTPFFRDTQGSDYHYEPWNSHVAVQSLGNNIPICAGNLIPTAVVAPRSSENSTCSKDSGYESTPSSRSLGNGRSHSISAALSAHSPAGVRPVQGENTTKYIYHSTFVIILTSPLTSNHLTDF